MNKSDFDYDHDNFQRMLSRAERGYTSAQRDFLEKIKHWSELSNPEFGGKISFAVSEDKRRIEGKVLDQSFFVHLSPHVTAKENYAQVILAITDQVSGKGTELSRFLVGPNGTVFSMNEEELLTWDTDFQSYKLLTALIRRVLVNQPEN